MTTSPTLNNTKDFPRHEKAHANGGVSLKEDPNSKVKVSSVVLNIMKSVGSKLKEGKILDLLKASRPAMISYPKTYLQCVADDLIYTELLDKAATARSPVTRMKYLVAFFMSGLHRNSCEMGSTGPLNPALGETFVAEKSDGTKLYCEQISHHPPVSAYYMTDAAKNYKLYGTGEVVAKLSGMNCIEGKRAGCTTIEFRDGGKVVIENPEMIIEGVMMGERILNHTKTFKLTDEENCITAEIKFLYNPASTVSKVASGIKSFFVTKDTSGKVLTDTFSLSIYNTETEKKELVSGGGAWLSFLEVGGEVLWKIDQQYQLPWAQIPNGRLESDSALRLDSKYIKERDYDRAQKEKDLLENNQRNDAKLRKPTGKVKSQSDKTVKATGKPLG